MSSRVSDLLGGLAPSATLAVDAKAKALKAAGEPVIGYGAGEPDFATPAHIVEAAAQACYDPRNHKYTPTSGLAELREAIAMKSKRDSGLDVAASQVLVTNGGKHAVATTFMTLLDPGDEVLIPAPYWTTYPEAVYLAGGVAVPVMTSEANGFRVTVEELERARTPRTKMLVFVSPSNPSGAVVRPEDVAAIGRWAAEHDVWVMSDEIYEHLVYGDATSVSLPVVAPEIGDRWVVVNGVAKTYAMTGWRIGWMVGPSDVMNAAINYQSQTTSNISNVSQRAAVAALTGDLNAVHEMRAAFDRRRRTMTAMLNAIEGVTCAEPEGAFYCYPNVTGLLGRDLGGQTSESSSQLAASLLETIKIAVVPGEAFGTPGYFRLSYALGDADLVEGLERLTALVAAG
ncbi:MAG: pyridoxal phosphate-dependent aminotransferase [Acidobacteriota bacterium]|nr:pyridoxal phosphate-dependent aminotransferase [Acidobacteriota bacterium]MDE3031824.1 pyridoxal phosphate-dependent aminotransferase [Acidobacteriota bacterium]MDE3093250.1 pyridoxal phosphate-dependent aminotransferase [Acidobacteriota bacterium]MDE3138449.1 pyridoxal phosphate-dependent aminotransferase [Acidobacteriota bacterium]MDE3146629.1 pyridoxal phosphate-dependent aminotransferase [Acidobacteriota bacterium]